ncbi:unnamed protein product [Aphanomyces euteiches]
MMIPIIAAPPNVLHIAPLSARKKTDLSELDVELPLLLVLVGTCVLLVVSEVVSGVPSGDNAGVVVATAGVTGGVGAAGEGANGFVVGVEAAVDDGAVVTALELGVGAFV